MFKKGIFLIGLAGLVFASCNKHEVIPAPELKVDLESNFQGNIGGQFKEFTENVDEYIPYPNLSSQSSGGITNAQYRFSMRSDAQIEYIEIAMGSLTWNDPTGSSAPALSLFQQFFKDNLEPEYSNGALTVPGGGAGFEVTYRDVAGHLWISNEISSYNQDAIFNEASIVQESDNNGDYSKFTCNFTCYVYHPDSLEVNPPTNPATYDYWTDSILITNAIYKGYFKR